LAGDLVEQRFSVRTLGLGLPSSWDNEFRVHSGGSSPPLVGRCFGLCTQRLRRYASNLKSPTFQNISNKTSKVAKTDKMKPSQGNNFSNGILMFIPKAKVKAVTTILTR
jgi:hypothetical protein